MRAAASLLAAALLAGCTLGTPAPEPAAPPPAGLTPDAEGLQPAGTTLRIDFGRAQPGVIDAVTRLLGEGPASVTRNGECGAGLVTAARWTNGLTLNFLEGDFRGWVVDAPGQPVAGGLSVGAQAPGVPLQDTTLGQEFQSGGVFGLVQDGATIDTLWSGTTCFFR